MKPKHQKVEEWKSIEHISAISIGDWLYYIDDHYFGKVEKIENQCVLLVIQNFRVYGSSYIAKISDMNRLKAPKKNIYIDWQIAEKYSILHKYLKQSFTIWSKIEPFILSLPLKERSIITPEPFWLFGKILGKWMSKGYLDLLDIETLESQKFIIKMNTWKKFDDIIESEEVDDTLLEHFDKVRKLSFSEALELSKNKEILLPQWVALQAGYIIDETNTD